MTTKLILTHDVSHLGSAGEVVEVKDGYARNYLLPRKLATPWTKGAQRQIDQMAEARRKRSIESLEHAQTARAWLQENVVTVSATAGDNGRLFGAVTTATLADAVKAAGGPAVDRRKIQVVPPIKSTGRHSASVRLHADVVAPLEVNVVPARGAPRGILPRWGGGPLGGPPARRRCAGCLVRRVGRAFVPLTPERATQGMPARGRDAARGRSVAPGGAAGAQVGGGAAGGHEDPGEGDP